MQSNIHLLALDPSFSSLKDVVADGLKGFKCRSKLARCQNVVLDVSCVAISSHS